MMNQQEPYEVEVETPLFLLVNQQLTSENYQHQQGR